MTAHNPKFSFGLGILGLLLGMVLRAGEARADEQLIIRQPGDHPVYSVEMEPHVAFAPLLPHAGSYGLGLGGRFSIPIVRNGFVCSINNSIAIGLGLDWVHYNGCIHDTLFSDTCSNLNTFVLPVVMQWNFFLSTHWSVFAEPGLDLYFRSFSGHCVARDQRGVPYDTDCPGTVDFDPFIFFVGGRYHFNETTTLTMRIGYPYFSVGVSFMP